MQFPTVFLNHGGGPLPLLGRQPTVVQHIKDVRGKIPETPDAIVLISAHWESNPISITSNPKPGMLFDYYGFPPETYKYKYDAPGSPDLARRIQTLLRAEGLDSRLDEDRGFDHGAFIPMMILYPDADIPIVCVSLHSSLSTEMNMKLGRALAPLRNGKVLIVGSGYTFHNLNSFMFPSEEGKSKAKQFNDWLKSSLLRDGSHFIEELRDWESAPFARFCHPREEHLLPLHVVAAAGGEESKPELLIDMKDDISGYEVSSYMFG